MALPLKERKAFRLFSLLILGHLVLISLQVPRSEDGTLFKQAFLAVLTPLQAAMSGMSREISRFWNNYLLWRDIREQNQKLRDEVFYLRQENILLKTVLQRLGEEAEIRERLKNLSSSLIVAAVVGSDAANIYKSIVINRGEKHKIKADMVVLDPQGNLVGRVINPVLAWTSRVQLITDDTSGVGAVTTGKGVSGVLRGDGHGRCYLDYVLVSSAEINVGEEVVTSGFDGIYPAGIPLGRVLAVSREGTLFRKIIIEPFFQLNGLVQVGVLAFDLKKF